MKKPGNPFWVPAREPGWLQGIHTLQALPHILLKVIDGIRSQKPEHRRRNLFLQGLGWNEFIFPAGIIDSIGEATPEGEAIGSHLVPANGAPQNAIPLCRVAQSHRIQHPGADGLGIPAIYPEKVRHVGIHQPFPLLRPVTHTVGAVHPVVVLCRDLPPERNPGPAAQGLCDFPPGRNLILLIQICLKERLIPAVHEGVIFEGIGPRKAVLLRQDDLVANGFEIIGNEPAGLHMGHADKMIYVHNSRLLHPASSSSTPLSISILEDPDKFAPIWGKMRICPGMFYSGRSAPVSYGSTRRALRPDTR